MKAMLKKMAHFIVQRGRIIEKFFIAMKMCIRDSVFLKPGAQGNMPSPPEFRNTF